MRLADFDCFRSYVEEACNWNHADIDIVMVLEDEAVFKIKNMDTNELDPNKATVIAGYVSQEMGRRGWKVDVFTAGSEVRVAFKEK